MTNVVRRLLYCIDTNILPQMATKVCGNCDTIVRLTIIIVCVRIWCTKPSPEIPKNVFHLHDSSRQVRIMMGVEGHWDNLFYLGPSCNFRYPREESVVVPPDSSHMDWITIPGATVDWLCLEARLPPWENVNGFKETNICFQIYLNSKLLWIKWRCAVGKGEIQKTRN